MLTTASVLASGAEHGWWPLWPLLWLAVIGTAVWLITRRRRLAAGGPGGGTGRAREILAERFARGEITNDEYSERLDQLQ